MSFEKQFAHLYDELLQYVENRDGHLRSMLQEANSTQRFSVISYHYHQAEDAVKAIDARIPELRLLQVEAAENRHLRRQQQFLIQALQTQRYVHVMNFYREALMVKELEPQPVGETASP